MAVTMASIRAHAARIFFMHLGSFVAVILFFVVFGHYGNSEKGLRPALLTALIVDSGYIALAYRYGEQKHFDVGIWIMYAIGTVAVYLGLEPVSSLYLVYSPAILFSALTLTAIVPVILGREPFTYYFARRQVPAWQLKTREFYSINRVMSIYWTLIFFTAAILCAYSPRDLRFTALFPNLVVFVLGVPATFWLPRVYLSLFPAGLPESIEPLIMSMPMAFRADAARNARVRIQFQVSGAEPGAYWLRIDDGKCESFEGVTEAPDLTVNTPGEVWVRIAHGQIDGAKALADGLYQVKGDSAILEKMKKWFSAG